MKKTTIYASIAVCFFATALTALAADYIPLAPLPGTTEGTVGSETTNLSVYLTGAIKLIVALGAAFAVLMMIVGGTQYVASGIAPSAKNDAKERIQNSIIGLILILVSYLILNSINPKLVAFNLGLEPVGGVPAGTVEPPAPPDGGGPQPVTYTIGFTAGTNCTVVPSGSKKVAEHGSQTYTITPDAGYYISNFNVDMTATAPVASYTFDDVTEDHAFAVVCNLSTPYSGQFTITATAGSNGVITPSGETSVTQGGSQSYAITPDTGYSIATLTVDGAPVVPPTPSYTFSNVTSARTVSVTFSSLSNTPPAGLDPTNDYSIITKCAGNTTYSLCLKTDLNGDGKTDSTDVSLFTSRGAQLDLNKNRILELADLPTPVSCFFKTSTVNVKALLPLVSTDTNGNTVYECGGNGTGITSAPTVPCNGATWLKASVLGTACADGSTSFNLDYSGGSGPYDKFKNWIVGAKSGNLISLTTLFAETFLSAPAGFDGATTDPYLESDVGKITYTTIAQYDLNNDGVVDLGSSGADMAVFNGCKGSAVSGTCAQADFNGDGAVDDKDVASGGTVSHPVVGSVADLVWNKLSTRGQWITTGWTIADFESYFFDLTGYSDKQIIKYWTGRKAVYGPQMIGDLNGDRAVNSIDLDVFNTSAPPLDFNGDEQVNLAL